MLMSRRGYTVAQSKAINPVGVRLSASAHVSQHAAWKTHVTCGQVNVQRQGYNVVRCQALQLGIQATKVLDGPISKDACTLQDIILSGQRIDDETGLRVAKSLLKLLAQQHGSTSQVAHGNINPETVYFPKGIQCTKNTKELQSMFCKPLPTGTAPCRPDQANLSQASATAQYIAPEHLAAAQELLAPGTSGATSSPMSFNPFSPACFTTMKFKPDLQNDGHIEAPIESTNWGLEASIQALSGRTAASVPTAAADCYQVGCVLMFAATGAQAQQQEGDLEARVIEVKDARGGPVGRVLGRDSKLSALIRGLLAVDAQDRLTAEQALLLIDDATWPPLNKGIRIPMSAASHIPDSFCFTGRRPLAQPWSSVDMAEPDDKSTCSCATINRDSLLVAITTAPGIFQKWVAPGALMAGCGTLAWCLARTAVMSAQPLLLAAAVPLGAAGALLGRQVHYEGTQADFLEIKKHSWTLTSGVRGSVSAISENCQDVLAGYQTDPIRAGDPQFGGLTHRLIGAKVASLEIVDDERTDTAILLCSACGTHTRFGSHLPLEDQQRVVAKINHHLHDRLQQPVTVENDLFPSTHASIDVDDFD